MGLDMSFYKLGGVKSISSTGEIETDEKYAMEEIKYYRKFNALHGLLNDLYLKRGGNDLNGLLINVGFFDINFIKECCLNKTLKPQEGFFWGRQDLVTDEEYSELLELVEEMESLIGEGWTIGYCGGW